MGVVVNSILKRLVICVFAMFFSLPTWGFVFAMYVLVNKDTKQRIVLLSDYHEDTEASIVQRKAILNEAKKLDAYLIVEDNGYRADYVGPDGVIAYPACFQPMLDDLVEDPVNFDPNKLYDADYSILDPSADNKTSPLLLLTPMARNNTIKTKTVECRQAEKISYRNGPISAAEVCKAYDALTARLAIYNDGALFNDFYKQKLEEYYARRSWCPAFFKHLEQSSKNLRQCFNERTYEVEVWDAYNRVEFDNYVHDYMLQGADRATAQSLASNIAIKLEGGCNLYSSFFMYLYNFLVDTAIIHEIAIARQESIIFAYCGSWHARAVLPVLQAAGFYLEKGWDASENSGQSALNLEYYFAQLHEQLQESINAKKEAISGSAKLLYTCNNRNSLLLDLIVDAAKFDQAGLPFGLPCIVA